MNNFTEIAVSTGSTKTMNKIARFTASSTDPERTSKHLPDFEDVITTDFLTELYENGQDHGSPHPASTQAPFAPCFEGINQFAIDQALINDEDHFPDLSEDQLLSVKSAFEAWLPARYHYVKDALLDGLTWQESNLCLQRSVYLPQLDIEDLLDGNTPHGLGEFWATNDPEAHWADHRSGYQVCLTALVKPELVDWKTTFRRQMDYAYGDEENEIFLPKGTPVVLLEAKIARAEAGLRQIKQPHRIT